MVKLRKVSRMVSRMAIAATEGVFAHAVDVTLWSLIYFAEMYQPQSVNGQLWRAQVAADRFLSKINYDTLKNALITAQKNRWVKKVRRGALPEITREGKKRLQSVLPVYDQKRVWDGRLHLVTYDIPERQKNHREILRQQLRRIGCGKLQDSVWITPYNPIDTLRTYINERDLAATVIISDLGADASIGEEDIGSLLVRVYGLMELNTRYKQWLEDVADEGGVDGQAVISYLSILKDDPQLPFALLPKWWKGDRSFAKMRNMLGSWSI